MWRLDFAIWYILVLPLDIIHKGLTHISSPFFKMFKDCWLTLNIYSLFDKSFKNKNLVHCLPVYIVLVSASLERQNGPQKNDTISFIVLVTIALIWILAVIMDDSVFSSNINDWCHTRNQRHAFFWSHFYCCVRF